jgi:hypothetical protein
MWAVMAKGFHVLISAKRIGTSRFRDRREVAAPRWQMSV